MMRAHSSISNFKWLLRFGVFVCLLGVISHLLGQTYEKATAFNVINGYTLSRYQDFYALPENSLDMVFLGSSHSYCTFDPANFDEPLGIASFQLGTPLQHPDTTYYSLLEVLNYQSPSVVVAEVYWDMLDDDFELKQAASFFEVLQNPDLQANYIKEVFPISEKVKYKLLPIRYQQDYFSWQASNLAKEIEAAYHVTKPNTASETNGTEYYLAKGYTYCDTVLPQAEYDETNQFKGLDGKDFAPDKTQMAYLQKIVDLCKEKGITLIFVTAPIANVSMNYIENYQDIHDQVAAFAAKNSVAYLDYNQIDLGLQNEHFRDDAHLNDRGVKIVDAHFLDYLTEKNIFPIN